MNNQMSKHFQWCQVETVRHCCLYRIIFACCNKLTHKKGLIKGFWWNIPSKLQFSFDLFWSLQLQLQMSWKCLRNVNTRQPKSTWVIFVIKCFTFVISEPRKATTEPFVLLFKLTTIGNQQTQIWKLFNSILILLMPTLPNTTKWQA